MGNRWKPDYIIASVCIRERYIIVIFRFCCGEGGGSGGVGAVNVECKIIINERFFRLCWIGFEDLCTRERVDM